MDDDISHCEPTVLNMWTEGYNESKNSVERFSVRASKNKSVLESIQPWPTRRESCQEHASFPETCGHIISQTDVKRSGYTKGATSVNRNKTEGRGSHSVARDGLSSEPDTISATIIRRSVSTLCSTPIKRDGNETKRISFPYLDGLLKNWDEVKNPQ